MKNKFIIPLSLTLGVTWWCASTVRTSDISFCSNSTPVSPNGCTALSSALPNRVYAIGTAVYDYEVQNFWSNTEVLTPECVFRPESVEDVSTALTIIQTNGTMFAVRGGGHMGIQGANSIDDGVLIVLSNLTSVELSHDHSNVTLGPGWIWRDVYTWLETYQLAVAGGRIASVGVPGLLLAGGVNFYGNQAGWAADNILEYEIVLASGEVVAASSDVNEDLFWALKGGSSNFGIVTKFTLRTFPSPGIWGGVYAAAENQTDPMLAAIANYSAFNTDPLSHLIGMAIATGPNTSYPGALMFYDSLNTSYPDCFAPFFDIPATANSLKFNSLAELSIEAASDWKDGYGDIFFAGTFVGKDYESLLEGVRITNELFFANMPELYAVVPSANIIMSTLNYQPIGSVWVNASRASNPSGNAFGLDVENKGTYIAWAGTVTWDGSEYDSVVSSWAKNTTNAINTATQAAGIYDAFIYIGDTAGFQLDEAFSGYGAENQQRLLNISRKYDTQRLFQTLLPGGFKIGL